MTVSLSQVSNSYGFVESVQITDEKPRNVLFLIRQHNNYLTKCSSLALIGSLIISSTTSRAVRRKAEKGVGTVAALGVVTLGRS